MKTLESRWPVRSTPPPNDYRFLDPWLPRSLQLQSGRFVSGGGVYGWMGTDSIGRDLGQGLLFGLPVALFIGLVSALITTSIGVTLGIASGYLGGVSDLLIQRFSDIIANVPVLPLLIFPSLAAELTKLFFSPQRKHAQAVG